MDIQGLIASQAANAPERKPAGDAQAMQAAVTPAAPIAPAAGSPSSPPPAPGAGASAPVGFLELARAAQSTPVAPGSNGLFSHGLFGDDGFGFDDVLDIINPLQHIPVVSSVYRALTGDHIDAGPRMIGGAALGGGLGFATAAINAAIEDQTGKDLGEHLVTALFGEAEDTKTQPVQFAAADPGGTNATDRAQAAESAAGPVAKPHGSVGIMPWYLAGAAPVPGTAEVDVAQGEGPQTPSSALDESPENEMAAIEPAAGPQDEPPQPTAGVAGASGRLHPLTKAQLAVLSQHESLSDDATGSADAAPSFAASDELGISAPGEMFSRSSPQDLTVASPGPGSAVLSQPGTLDIPELTPDQLSLLLSSVGANEPPTTASATVPDTAPGAANEAKASTPADAESTEAPAATARRPTPVTALPLARPFTHLTPSGAFAAAGVQDRQPDPAVAQKMQRGLDQYFKNPRGVNPRPLHVDVIR